MKPTLSTFFFIILSFLASAQISYQIKGKVVDSTINLKLENASISVLNAKDSTLIKFKWADVSGNFHMYNLKNGKFILLLSYPDYADYIQQFTLDSIQNTLDFGSINLSSRVRLLNEVIIKGKVAAIKMKGDTTEFNAKAFVIQPNDKVEDLLRQLPGIQVDNKGQITAQGKIVRKILVDGEEFFGDDPTLVTRNLRGDMIDKVQLYDKKSDQATFTGIDDGIKEKTINLKLKEDKKRGYFGKVDVGGGSSGFYQGQAMANLFREKRKMAVYGNSGNTGRTGLSSSENSKYGTDGGTIEFITGGVMITGTNADEIESSSGRYSGQGIPLANTSGVHYDGKWNKDKEWINANAKIGSLQVDGERSTLTQSDLPSGFILSDLKQNFSNYNFRQRFDATYQINFNPSATLKIKVDGINKESESTTDYVGTSVDKSFNLLNTSWRKLTSNGDQRLLNLSAFFTKKFKKEKRTLSWNLTEAFSSENTDGYLNAVNDFYSINGDLSSTQHINQFKTSEKSLEAINSNITFSEGLSKTFSAVFNYRLGLINSRADRKSFNPSATGSYTLLDREFSNDFELDQFSNQGGVAFVYDKAKNRINFGTKLTTVDFRQKDRYANSIYNRNFLNWNPQTSYTYRPSQQKMFQLSYFGNTLQPSIDQIQPIKVNTDPLNVVVGNADLVPAFKHDLTLSYSSYTVVTGWSLNIISGYGLTSNPIVNLVNTDGVGRSTYQAINLKNKDLTNIVLRGTVSKQIKAIEALLSIEFFYNAVTNYGISNGEINTRKNNFLTSSFYFNKFKVKKYDFGIGFGPRVFNGSSSLQSQATNNGYGYDGFMNLNVYLPSKFEFRSNSTFNYQSKTESFDKNYQALIVNASIGRKFLKDETLKFSVSANDLLNQNIGFNRYSYGTMVTQSKYTNIARYFMCSLTWDFAKFGKALSK